jgi:hypothetical protein
MNYLERYKNGEYQQVWEELLALGPKVRQEPHFSQAWAVAEETMRRVQRNCALIVSRLEEEGYTFGVYPDGSKDYFSFGPLVPPTEQTSADIEVLEEMAGPIPLSLLAFWKIVGSVDLVGMRQGWPFGRDPLVVELPAGAIDWLENIEFDLEGGEPMEAALAPDDLHKDHTSGGSPYVVRLPDESADFLLRNEYHGLYFVPYLRLAILDWGGFPGLDTENIDFEPLPRLVADLEEF